MTGKKYIAEGYKPLHQVLSDFGTWSSSCAWKETLLPYLLAAIEHGETKFTAKIPIQILKFNYEAYYTEVEFSRDDFFIPEDRRDSLGVKDDPKVLEKFELVAYNGIRKKPPNFLDFHQLAEILSKDSRFDKYKSIEGFTNEIMQYFCDCYIEELQKQVGKKDKIKLPQYLIVAGRVFNTKELGLFAAMGKQNRTRFFCISESALSKLLSICVEEPKQGWIMPLPREIDEPQRTAMSAMNVSNKVARPIISAIKTAYQKWLVYKERQLEHGSVPSDQFFAEFNLSNSSGKESFRIAVNGSECGYFCNPSNGRIEFYVTERLLAKEVAPHLSLSWKLSYNDKEGQTEQSFASWVNIRSLREVVTRKLSGKCKLAEMGSIVEMVSYLAHTLAEKSLKSKPINNGFKVQIGEDAIEVMDDISFAKFKSSYRFSLSDKLIDNLIEIARGKLARGEQADRSGVRATFAR